MESASHSKIASARHGTDLADRVLAGDWRALARAITVIENDQTEAAALVARLYPRTGHAHIIGVTGPPGAGKSTLVYALAARTRKEGLTVGVDERALTGARRSGDADDVRMACPRIKPCDERGRF